MNLSSVFTENQPFPHIVIDNFYPEDELNKVADEIENISEETWNNNNVAMGTHQYQQRKSAIRNTNVIGPHSKSLVDLFNSDLMLAWLTQITGIKNLKRDPYNLGGGLHRTQRGGKLSIHADFNTHPNTNQYRRLNALLYMNRDWKEEWNGHLELWNKDMSERTHNLLPIFNRLVIFATDDHSYHGHPEPLECPEDRARLSFAFYYYTDTHENYPNRPPYHGALWQQRHDKGY